MKILRDFLIDGDFDGYEIDMIINRISKVPISELLANHFKEDGFLLGWHSNIACWIMDNFGVVDYEKRNVLAQKFIERFFKYKYDWVKLLNPNNCTYSADMELIGGNQSVELVISKEEFREKKAIEKLGKLKPIVFEDYPPLEDCKNPDVIHLCLHCNECGRFTIKFGDGLEDD